MTSVNPDFEEYVALAQCKAEPSFLLKAEYWIRKFFGTISLDSPLAPAIYLLDYSKKKYVYVHPACQYLVGWNADYFIDGGMESWMGNWHQEDYLIWKENIFWKNLTVVEKASTNGVCDFVFTCTYRTKTSQGTYIPLMQKFTFILNDHGAPIGSIGYVIDISGLKMEKNKIVHIIERVNQNSQQLQPIFRKIYYPGVEMLISKRELEVLKWICEGLSSKQIADRIFISVNTVNNHRKSMLMKTGTANTAELLKFAITNGYL